MNIEHKDIDKFIPYGEMLRGYANQNIISNAEIHRILRERGIFTLNQEKEYNKPDTFKFIAEASKKAILHLLSAEVIIIKK